MNKVKHAPLTRSILQPESVCPCHTMKRLIELMRNHNITSDFLKEMMTESSASGRRNVTEDLVESPPEEKIKATRQPSLSQVCKAQRKKENRRIKKNLNKKIKNILIKYDIMVFSATQVSSVICPQDHPFQCYIPFQKGFLSSYTADLTKSTCTPSYVSTKTVKSVLFLDLKCL